MLLLLCCAVLLLLLLLLLLCCAVFVAAAVLGVPGTPGSGSRRGDKTAQMVARAPKIIPVVPQPPKTGYDFEKDVLSLLKYPAVLFKYIRVSREYVMDGLGGGGMG